MQNVSAKLPREQIDLLAAHNTTAEGTVLATCIVAQAIQNNGRPGYHIDPFDH